MKAEIKLFMAILSILAIATVGYVATEVSASEDDEIKDDTEPWMVDNVKPGEAPGKFTFYYGEETIEVKYASTTGVQAIPGMTVIKDKKDLFFVGIRFIETNTPGIEAKVTNIVVDDFKDITMKKYHSFTAKDGQKHYYYPNSLNEPENENITVTIQFMYADATYTLSIPISIVIFKANLELNAEPLEFIYNGNPQGPTVTIKESGKVIYEKGATNENITELNFKEVSFEVGSATDAGNYTLVVTLNNSDIYNDYSNKWAWTISPASFEAELSCDSFIYNGQKQAPTYDNITINNEPLDPQKYTLTVEEKVKPGKYVFYVSSNDTYNYTGSADGTWIIEKKEIDESMVFVDPTEITYTGEKQTPKIGILFDKAIGKPNKLVSKYYIGEDNQFSSLIPYKFDFGEGVIEGEGPTTVTVESNDLYVDGIYSFNGLWKVVNPVDLSELGLVVTVDELALLGGEMNAEMFTDENTFVFPIHKTYPDFNRSNYTVVVLNGNGDTIVDEINGISGSTESEKNWIYLTGTNGFTGTIWGVFDVEIQPFNENTEDDELYYTLNNVTKTATVTGCKEGVTDIVVPDSIQGYAVTGIADKAFYGNEEIISVDFGNVVRIGIKSFTNCRNLEDVDFGDSLKTISAYAFYNCRNLKTLDMPDTVKTIGHYAFYKCVALEEVNFSEKLNRVGGNAFSVSFIGTDGKKLDQTPDNLKGNQFIGSKRTLVIA